MPSPSSETRNFDALLSTTLANWAKGIEDNIASSNFLFYALRKSGAYKSVAALGERAQFPLIYATGNADAYSDYDPIDTTPIDGITMAFFNWAQIASTISISRIEERKNAGEFQMVNLLDTKAQQSLTAVQELFGKALLQGNGPNSATAITTAYTSTINGATLFAPLPLLVSDTAAINASVGNINPSTYSWWVNQRVNSTSSTFAGFLKEISNCRNLCSKGVGGPPDLHVTDQSTFELYEAALRSQNRYNDTMRADIPFDNIAFHGKPVVWDEYMPNWSGGTTVQSTTQGTWVMLNSKNFGIQYDSQTNFSTSPFITPENQDAKTAKILWYGTTGINNRRKHGVVRDIDTTITA